MVQHCKNCGHEGDWDSRVKNCFLHRVGVGLLSGSCNYCRCCKPEPAPRCFECHREYDLVGNPIKLFSVKFSRTEMPLCQNCKEQLEKARKGRNNAIKNGIM